MNYSAISLIALAFPLIFSSCKNDLDVLAPGKESVSVYAIINPNQRTQNVRINKVYLTDGDAIAAGQDANTINYGPNELRVTLQRFVNNISAPTTVGNNIKREIVLTETVITTAAGAFNSEQRLWQTSDKLFGTGQYKLTITNNSTGTTYTAQTTVIDSVKPAGAQQPMPILYNTNYPMHGNYPPFPTSLDKPKYVNYENRAQTYQIRFRSIPNARLYNVVMRFHYIDTLTGGGVNQDFVDYNFTNAMSSTLEGGTFVEDPSGISYFRFTGDDFYRNLGAEMAKKSSANVLKRRSFYMEYIVTAGSESLSEFMQINAPSTSIAQDKPLYSNISGGVGVFSSRSATIVTKDLWNDFIDKIACHPSTNPYRFCNSSGQISASVCN